MLPEEKTRLAALCRQVRGNKSIRAFLDDNPSLGVSRTAWHDWELGKGASVDRLKGIAKISKVPYTRLNSYIKGKISLNELLPQQSESELANTQDLNYEKIVQWLNNLTVRELSDFLVTATSILRDKL